MRRRNFRKKKKHTSRYILIPLSSLLIFMLYLAVTRLDFIGLPTLKDFSYDNTKDSFPSSPDLIRDIPETNPPFETISPPAPVIKNITISSDDGSGDKAANVFIQNKSGIDINISDYLKKPLPISLAPKGVQVLIVHTHGSESYTPTSENYYIPSETDRTLDTHFNVVRVGDEIETILEKNGISVLHIREIFDSPSYSGSYTRSLEAISSALKSNPSIRVIMDIHRDSMISKNGTKYKTTAQINGKSAAQLMFVTGTDGGGLSHDNWRKNLTFQAKIHQAMNSNYPGIMRPMIIRKERFNQHVSYGSMLLEVGTSGNTLEEAVYSASLFADTLSGILKPK